MNSYRGKLRVVFTLTLLLLLSIQLTGLTCLGDGQSYVFFGDRPVSVAHSESTTDSPVDGSSLPSSQQQFSHHCPCHMVTYLSGFTLASAPYNGMLGVPAGPAVDDNFPQAIFRPPFFLL